MASRSAKRGWRIDEFRVSGLGSPGLFCLIVVGGGLAIGSLTAPGEWYGALAKPSFNPPSWVFAPIWTILYVLIAVSGWRISRHGNDRLLQVWWLQLVLNFLWSPMFFMAHQTGVALFVVLLLLATVLALIITAWAQDRVTAYLLMPYAAWVAFASLLNAAIWRLN